MPRTSLPRNTRFKSTPYTTFFKAETARHDRVALEMAGEEPEIGTHVELGADHALAVRAAGLRDFGDPVEHQHGRKRKLGVALTEQFAASAGQQVFVFEARAPIAHLMPFVIVSGASAPNAAF
jgi:hypothetical protein